MTNTPIAIVGMSCLVPGAGSPDELWTCVRDEADHRVDGGGEHFGDGAAVPGGWGDPQHHISSTVGGFVREPDIDLSGLRIPADELAGMDRVVRWPLHTARLALADAGLDDAALPARTGFVLGNYSFPTELSSQFAVPLVRKAVHDGLRAAGLDVRPATAEPAVAARNIWPSGLPTNVIGEALGLRGPRLALDAACASALYGLALARDQLATGNADVMLAGAVCAPDAVLLHLAFSDLRALSTDGAVSQPFDERSAGIIVGQGAGMFVLKRLSDALRDGDRVHAVIDAIGLSNDGAGKHLLVPNEAGQLAAYRQAYSDLDPSTVDYIECHATGTPIGDATELIGLAEFFAEHGGPPLLGSMKGNVGHLLSAAGLASMVKAILAMRHGIIPATPGVAQPLAPEGGEAAAERVVRAECPWPSSGRPRRVGVSSFGFGGANAHVVLSQAQEAKPTPSEVRIPRMAVTGVGVKVGDVDDVAAFERVVRTAEPILRTLPEGRWYSDLWDGQPAPAGGYLERIEVDPRAYRLLPAELAGSNPQHLALFQAMEAALLDAGYPAVPPGPRTAEPPARVAVVIAMEMEPRAHQHRARFDIGAHVRTECARAGVQLGIDELDQLVAAVRDAVHDPLGANEVLSYIGNIMASRISASRNFSGPSFTISSDSTAGAAALEVAGLLLLDPSIETVVVGGVDLACGMENTLVRSRLAAEQGVELAPLGDGAAAVVLTRADQRPASYATIESVALRHGTDAVADAARVSLASAGISGTDVDYLELSGGTEATRRTELAQLATAYRVGEDPHSCAVGSVASLVGDTQRCSALLSLVQVALCQYRADLPPTPFDGTELSELDGSPFCCLEAPQPWLRRHQDRPRYAAISSTDSTTAAHLVVASADTAGVRHQVTWAEGIGAVLLPLTADDGPGLADQARRCLDELDSGRQLRDLARERWTNQEPTRLTAVLVAMDSAGMRVELEAAQRGLPETVAAGGEWATPSGSFCTARPIGPGRVAFVYPGAFTAYPGVARDLFRLFPQTLTLFEQNAEEPADRFRHRALYPRAVGGLDRRALLRHEADLLDDTPSMLITGSNLAVVHTQVLRDVLGIAPDGAFGYSLGEGSMLASTGVWQNSPANDAAIMNTPLFRTELCGPKRVVRETWEVAEDVPDQALWSTHVLLTSADRVREAMRDLERVFITHVNAPGEVVIAGAPEVCRELIARLGCQAAKAPANHVLHCSLVDPTMPELTALADYPLGPPPPDVELLTAYDYGQVDTDDVYGLAGRVSATLSRTLDFERLTRVAYDRGFRFFVEVGPNATCTRWIGQTLGAQPHLAVSIDRRGMSTGNALPMALARLISHGMRIDVTRLLGAPETPQRRLVQTVNWADPGAERVRRGAVAALAQAPQSPPPSPERIEFDGDPFVPFVPRLAESSDAGVVSGSGRHSSQNHSRPVEPAEPPPSKELAIPAPAPRAALDGTRPLAVLSSTIAQAHQAVLRTQATLQQIALERLEPALVEDSQHVLWTDRDLVEFAEGDVAKVFGSWAAEIDALPRRVRLPAPPFLFTTRVVVLEDSGTPKISTEYDVPVGAWFTVDGQVPGVVTVEAGQCVLLLASYLGVDLRHGGARKYRLLDSAMVFHGPLPREGQTLRYDISIDRMVWNDERLIFFFSYRCYADGELILELSDGCGGFFTDDELANSPGVMLPDPTRTRRGEPVKRRFKPLARTDRTELSKEDLKMLAAGELGGVFGPEWDQRADWCNPSIRLPGEAMSMIDEVVRIDRLGGPCELGELEAVQHIDADDWFFRCHFVGDPVLPGSLIGEGGTQLLQVFAMYLGLHLVFPDAEFQPVPELRTEFKVRSQVVPGTPNIRYHAEITEITLLPRPTVIADITVYQGDKPIMVMNDFGIQVREKPGTPYRPERGGIPPFLGRRNHNGEPVIMNEFHAAHAAKGDLATAMGPEFEIYRGRRAPYIPNGDFLFTDRMLRLEGTRGVLEPGAKLVTEYDAAAEDWYFAENSSQRMPNCVFMETSLQSAILLGYYLGPTLRDPGTDYGIRNLDGKATLVADLDLRDRTIRQESVLLSSHAMPGAIIQSFRYTLEADGQTCYVGESTYGYFSEQALANQVGLDAGKQVPTWLAAHEVEPSRIRSLSVRSDDRWFQPQPGTGLRLADGHLRLVDSVDLVADGGEHGLGYLHGRRHIDPADWYFDCHFHLDPVMPGSLGVESVIQALQVMVIDLGLADDLGPATFAMATDVELTWKYRGQVSRTDPEMTFEAHVAEIRREDDRVVVVADASVWKSGLRIYQLGGVAVEVRRSSPSDVEEG
ncbi:polyketide synthase [Saccharopolyspora sp. K220]|uniref:beta-ketoacyl synthase N-terminal-like domain-containing protein n=1 Tax=Saccharopolyspora soli TaxID=2926618 RepID=UPI001F5A2DD1|nr:beta-ketoacyl synthase N-terminal-like domain-containing protein [Saccharopolyspora soli]MCI2416128.1 polyketide synthase [Saccharopolyspora soli]